jgi:tol-pal system protein YbgF
MRVNKSVLAAAIVVAAAMPVQAGLFDDDVARKGVEELRRDVQQYGRDNDQRLQRLEEGVRNIGVVELVRQIEALNTEIARLRGQIEVLANQNEQLQKRQRDFYLDIDSRLKRLEGSAPAAAVPSPAPVAAAVPPAVISAPPAVAALAKAPTKDDQGREMKAYDAASNLFRKNDFASSVDAFRAFLKDYPQSALAPNAEYWIGISYANLKDYRNATATQEGLLARYPQSPKAPDALLALASIQAEQGDNGSARNTLEDIIAKYPLSEAAGKARTRLAALRR